MYKFFIYMYIEKIIGSGKVNIKVFIRVRNCNLFKLHRV